MYYFFGVPYAIKVLAPIVLLSGLGGTLFAYMEECQKVKFENEVLNVVYDFLVDNDIVIDCRVYQEVQTQSELSE